MPDPIVYSAKVVATLLDPNANLVGTQLHPLIVQAANPGAVVQALSGNLNAAGDHILVPGTSGKKVHLYAFSLFAPAGTALLTITFSDGIGGAVLFSALAQAPNQSIFSFQTATTYPTFLFQTSAGNALNLNLSLASQVLANLSYWID